jgi:hypothetical protein
LREIAEIVPRLRARTMQFPEGTRERFLAELELESLLARTVEAVRHDRLADEAFRQVHLCNVDHCAEDERCRRCKECWLRRGNRHRSLARGQRDKFDRVRACGAEDGGTVLCESCENAHPFENDCDSWRDCPSCRTVAARGRQRRFGIARATHIEKARRLGGFRRIQRGGRIGERFLTLTMPQAGLESFATIPAKFRNLQGDELVAAMRIETMFQARRKFGLLLNKHWRKRRCVLRPVFYIAFEWTPGHDLHGHPHFHTWMLSQYIDHRNLTAYWSTALRWAGLLLAPDDLVVVHIKELVTPIGFARELFKGSGKLDPLKLSRFDFRDGTEALAYADGWSLAEIAKDGTRVPARIVAAVRQALERRKVAQPSPGLLGEKLPAACPECGVIGALRVRLHPPPTEQQRQAPPATTSRSRDGLGERNGVPNR